MLDCLPEPCDSCWQVVELGAGHEDVSGPGREAGHMRREPQQAAKVEGSEARTMAEILATKTSLAGYEMPSTFEVVRAEALFVSTLQPSGSPSPDQIRRAAAAGSPRLCRAGGQRVR